MKNTFINDKELDKYIYDIWVQDKIEHDIDILKKSNEETSCKHKGKYRKDSNPARKRK
jgi:hypothetical protein